MPESIASLPEIIESEEMLDEVMTRPSATLIAFVKTLKGPLVVLGAGGKMGPTLAVRAKRAMTAANCKQEVLAVSRFSDPRARDWLESQGVRTLNADLLSRDSLSSLPDAQNVIYLVGLKFGTAQNPALTWAMNTLVPAHVCERYPAARIVVLSSGNVYPLVPISSGGALEDHPLTPIGEYPNACIARERIFQYFSEKNGTPMTTVRLSYAVELRYGVLLDMARKIWDGESIEVTQNRLNWIWQGDANEMIIRMLAMTTSPPTPLNLTGPEPVSIRDAVTRLSELLQRPAKLTGTEANTAFISNPARVCAALGEPTVQLDTLLNWVAHWVRGGQRTLGKPTHFEVRDGKY